MFRLAMFVQWIGIFSLFGLNVIIPLYLQRVHEMGAADAGRVLMPMGIVAFVTMNVAGKFYERLGPRPIIMAGLAVLASSTFFWMFATAGTSTYILVILVSMRGLGVGMFGQFVQIVAYNTVAQEDLPRATSLVTTGQRLTTAFSTAILSSVLIVGLTLTNAPAGTSIAAGTAPLDAQAQAFRYAFGLMTSSASSACSWPAGYETKPWRSNRKSGPRPPPRARSPTQARPKRLRAAAPASGEP